MTSARTVPLLLAIAAAAVVGAALFSEFAFGLRPCELCFLERIPYYVALALNLVALALGRPGVTRAIVALTGLVFVVGAGLGFYHVGVEQHWFAGPSACTGGRGAASVAELKALLMATQPVRCDEVQWSLFGISLAGFNLIISLVLVVFALSRLRTPALRARTA